MTNVLYANTVGNYGFCIHKVLVAPVLWDSKSLPQSRGSFYSKKDDCITRLCPTTKRNPVSLLEFLRNQTKASSKCRNGSNVQMAGLACKANTHLNATKP